MLHFLGADDDYIKSLKALIESLLEKDAQGEDYIVLYCQEEKVTTSTSHS